MKLVPSFDLGESSYRIQLRPLVTAKEDRDEGRQNFGLCLWLTRAAGSITEICALSGFIIDRPTAEEGDVELFRLAKRWLLMTQTDWNALNKDDRRTLAPGHAHWREDEAAVATLTEAIDAEIAARS